MTNLPTARLYALQIRPKAAIIRLAPDGSQQEEVLSGLAETPDGIFVDPTAGLIYWTNMGDHIRDTGVPPGEYFAADGTIECANLDGSNRRILVGHGLIVTPKQMTADLKAGHLYWCDREGMRVMRSNLDGTNVTVLVRRGIHPVDMPDETRHCVGITLDLENRLLYWGQKGPPDAGLGAIYRAGLDLPDRASPEDRPDIELLIDKLPEPIDLELDTESDTLYWSDRGNLADGNTLNAAKVGPKGLSGHRIIARGLAEGIGVALDHAGGRAFVSDLSGAIRVSSLAPDSEFKTIATLGMLTGLYYLPG